MLLILAGHYGPWCKLVTDYYVNVTVASPIAIDAVSPFRTFFAVPRTPYARKLPDEDASNNTTYVRLEPDTQSPVAAGNVIAAALVVEPDEAAFQVAPDVATRAYEPVDGSVMLEPPAVGVVEDRPT